MTRFHFLRFRDYEDGKIAMLTTSEDKIPVNIFIDNYDDVAHIDECDVGIDVCGMGSNIKVYPDKEGIEADPENHMAPISMIPVGTFPIESNRDTFELSPHIFFSGKVTHVEINPDARDGAPNYCLRVETLEMVVELYLRSEETISPNNYVHGVAWLFGDLIVE